MAGFGDALTNFVLGRVPGDAARKSRDAMSGGRNDGHTTSGMDAAMQDHADKVHPVGSVDSSQLTRNPDGSISFPK